RTARDLAAQAELGTRIIPAIAEQLAAETSSCDHTRRPGGRPAVAIGGARAPRGGGGRPAPRPPPPPPRAPRCPRPQGGNHLPATEHGFQDATTSHRQVERWWSHAPEKNVAIATGAPGPDVVDIDRHGDKSGFPALRKLSQAGLVGEPSAMVRTPRGGAHLYY